MRNKQKKTARPGRQKIRIHEVTAENDMRYRGPLSFQHFMALGWACIVLAQVVVILKLGGRFDQSIAEGTADFLPTLDSIADFSLPFLLIATFAQILDTSNGYRKQLIKNLGATAAICGLYYLFFYRYLIGGLEALITDPSQAMPTIQSALDQAVPYGFLCFNLFVDLLLCTLVMLFLNYKPKHIFKGKSVVIFRLLTLLPIGYEVGCMAMKIQSARGMIEIPAWAYPLLPVKPPMTFVLFIALAVYVKTRELRFRRHGKTHEEYKAFLKTNRNSWNFSVFLAIMMVIVSILDLGVVLGFSLNEGVHYALEKEMESAAVTEKVETDARPETINDETGKAALIESAQEDPREPAAVTEAVEQAAQPDTESVETGEAALTETDQDDPYEQEMFSAVEKGAYISIAVGFGGSIGLAFLAPFVLLFSYTRKPKNELISMLIPAAGCVLIVALYLEAFHQALFFLPIPKIDLAKIREYAEIILFMMSEQGIIL